MLKLIQPTPLKTYKPLERVSVSSDAPGMLSVADGAGREYFRAKITDTASFAAGGALGRHAARLLGEDGKPLDETEFLVQCDTGIDDEGGLFRRLLSYLRYTMCAFSEEQSCLFEGKVYRFFVCWLRDHVHTLKGEKYFQGDLKSAIELYRDSQREDGMIWDNVYRRHPGRNGWQERFEYGNFIRVVEDGRLEFKRIPVENDVEFLYIEGIYYTWKATGDDGWMAGMLDSAIRAYNYSQTSPYRWSEKYKLLKRGFTIDTWDFQGGEDAVIAGRDIMKVYTDRTRFGVMHGDNTGFAVGCRYLAEMLARAGRGEEAAHFEKLGKEIKERLDKLAWNGRFYTHHVPEDERVKRDFGVDQSKQISLSNAYGLNRTLTHAQCASIIKEYMKIKDALPEGSPGEWYTIYPPFEYGFEEANDKWEYMNGGVTPIVAGELAHGAFEHGFEAYGADILRRVCAIAGESGGYLDCCLKGSLPEPPAAQFITLDISASANAAEGIPGWDGSHAEEYDELPPGRQTLRGIPFSIPDRAKSGGRSCILVKHDNPAPKGPAAGADNAAVPAGTKAKTVYLLHAVSGRGLAGHVTLRYADGGEYTKYISEGSEALRWHLPEEPVYAGGQKPRGDLVIAWEGKNQSCGRVGVSVYGLANPRPDAEIARVEFGAAKDGNAWAVFGVTLSDGPVHLKQVKTSFGIPDNWGAAAVVYALVEGLAGITDAGTAFEAARLSPRWSAAGVNACAAAVKYPASGGYLAYDYRWDAAGKTLTCAAAGSGKNLKCHMLLPAGAGEVASVEVNGTPVQYGLSKVEGSGYVDFDSALNGVAEIAIRFR